MTTNHTDNLPLEQPHAEFERQLIRTYVAGAGQDLETLLARDDDEARTILAGALRYASTKLSEVEARSQYVHQLHSER